MGDGDEATEAVDMRMQILSAAARMLCEAGYAGTTMRLIAEACGIKAASLYHHFPSKDDLVLEVLNEGICQVDAAVRAALSACPDGAPFRTRFLTAVRTHLHSFLEHGEFTAANLRTFKQTPAEVQARNTVLRGQYEALWRALIEEGTSSGLLRADADARTMRLFLLGGMNAAVEWYRPGGLTIDELAEQYTALFIDGAAADPAGSARPAASHGGKRRGATAPVRSGRAR